MPFVTDTIMTILELSAKIQSWIWCYRHIPFPSSGDHSVTEFNESVSQKWYDEMYADVTALEIPTELLIPRQNCPRFRGKLPTHGLI